MNITNNYGFTIVPKVTNMTVGEFREAVAGEEGNFARLDSILAAADIVSCSVMETTNDLGEAVYELILTHKDGTSVTTVLPYWPTKGYSDLLVVYADGVLSHTYTQINEHILGGGNVFLYDEGAIYILNGFTQDNMDSSILSGYRFARSLSDDSQIVNDYITVWDDNSVLKSSVTLVPALAKNLVTEITEESTDEQFPSAKAVYDNLATKADVDIVPRVFDWAIADLPFTENEITGVISGGGFVVNPANYTDGRTYFRYHAGSSYGYLWTNPNPQPGSLTITAKAYSQYSETLSTKLVVQYSDGTDNSLTDMCYLTHGKVVTYVTPADKTVISIRGNYDFENWVLLDMDVMSIVADYPAPSTPGTSSESVLYVEQELTQDKQAQARTNIGAASENTVYTLQKGETLDDVPEDAKVILDPYSDNETVDVGQFVKQYSTCFYMISENGAKYKITINSDGALMAECEKVLNGITADYIGGVLLGVGATFHTLRDHLTVTAMYSDGSSENITDYTLSSSLEGDETEGSSLDKGNHIITVSYYGMTDTFEIEID